VQDSIDHRESKGKCARSNKYVDELELQVVQIQPLGPPWGTLNRIETGYMVIPATEIVRLHTMFLLLLASPQSNLKVNLIAESEFLAEDSDGGQQVPFVDV
jgi:hypothetical protein